MAELSELSDEELTSAYRSLSDDDLMAEYKKAQTPQQDLSSMSDADLTSAYRSMSDDDLLAAYKGASGKEAEGLVGANLREAAHAVVPAVGGVLAGGIAGGLAGTAFGPVGSIVGGVGGMILGSMAADAGQSAVLKTLGVDDDPQRQLNAEKHGLKLLPGQVAPFIGSPVLAAEKGAGLLGQVTGNALKQRGVGAAMMGGFSAAQQGMQGDIDPAHVAAEAAFGAFMPSGNRVTRAIHGAGTRMVTPEAQDAARSQSPSVAGNNALEQQPAADPQAPIGQENSKAAGPEDYRKKPAVNAEDTVLGEGGFSQGGVTENKTTMSALAPEQVPVKTGIEEAGRPVQPAPQPDLIQNQREELERVLQRTDLGLAARKQLEARLAKFGGPTERPQAALLPEEPVKAQLAPAEPEYTPQQQAERLAKIEAKKQAPQATLLPEEPAKADVAPVQAEVPDATRIRRMRAAGMNKLADMYEQMPVEQRAKLGDVIDRQLPQTTKHAPDRRESDHARLINKLGNEAKTKPLREQHDSAIDAIQKAYDSHPPKEVETAEELMARLRAAVDTAHGAHGSNPLNPAKGYHPRVMPETFLWYKKVQELAARRPVYWTANKIAEFKADEAALRSKAGKEVEYPDSDPGQLDRNIEMNRHTGDELVTNTLDSRATNPEDDIIAAIDKRGKERKAFEGVDTEEQETSGPTTKTPIKSRATLKALEKPRVTLDLTKPEDEAKLAATLEKGQKAKKLKDEIAARAEAAMKEKGAKRSGIKLSPEEVEAQGARVIKIDDATKAAALARMAEAEAKGKSRDAPKKSYIAGEKYKDEVKDLTGAFVRLAGDETGALNGGKIWSDLKDWSKPHYVSSSRAKTLTSMEARNTAAIGDKLQAGIQQDKIDKTQAQKMVDRADVKPFRNQISQKELYLAHEKGDMSTIKDTDLKDFYDKVGKPIMEENSQLKDLIDHLAPDKLGRTVLNHIYRMAEGHNFREDAGGAAYDPVSGTNPLSTRERGTAIERTFVALERGDGRRFVLSLPEEGAEHQATLWEKYKGTNINIPKFEFKDGSEIKVGNNKYKMTDALTEEIEANALNEHGTPMKYRKNFMESALNANTYLRSLARHLQLLDDIKGSPEFQAYSTTDYKEAKAKGWEQSKTTLPGFKGHYMDPQIREVLDDFKQPGFDEHSLNRLRNLSRAVTKTIFWLPTAHALNVGAHWYVGRGWDWLSPKGYKSLAIDGMKSIKSVIAQDHLQRRLAENGWGGVYSGILGQNFEANLARKLGQHIEREPSKWGPVADKLDMTVGDLVRSIYSASSKSMWAANDMFLTQSILENLRKVGVDEKSATDLQIQQAIKRAERHIPNYRMPSRIISSGEGGRTLAKALGDPLTFAFGRYHVGVYNSFAHIVKGLTKGSGPERFEAIGHLFAMATLVYAIKPAVDKVWQAITGNEDAEARGRGPLGPVGHVKKMIETGDPSSLIRSTATMSPLGSVVMDVLGDFTGFGDKRIVNRGDLKDAVHGDIKAGGKVLAQGAGFLAGNLVAPVGTLNSTLGKDQSVLGGLRDQVLDIDNPSDRLVAFKGKIDRLNAKETIKREKRPPTIFEKLYQ